MKNLTVQMENCALVCVLVIVCLLSQAATGFAQQNVDEKLKEIKSLIDKEDYDVALRRVEEVFKTDSNNALAYEYRGIIYHSRRPQDFEQAIINYNRAIELNPNVASYYINRGLAFQHKPNPDYVAAEKDFLTNMKLDPNAAFGGKDYLDLLAMDKQKQNPAPVQDKSQDLANRADSEFLSGNYDQAMVDANASIDLNPRNYLAYRVRGFCHIDNKRYEEAIADETKAIDIKPNDTDAYFARALANEHLNRTETAVADYQTVIDLSPGGAVINTINDDILAKIVSSRGADVTSSSNAFNAQQLKLDTILSANPSDAAACQAIIRFMPYLDGLNKAMQRVEFVKLINTTSKIDVSGNIDIINDNERIVANKMTFINVQKIRFKCQP